MTHGGVVNLAGGAGRCWCGWVRGAGCCSSPSVSFDASVCELWVALLAGGSLVLACAAERLEARLLGRLVAGTG